MAEFHQSTDMNGQYAYTPHIWPSVLTVFFLIGLGSYSWHRRNVPGALPFAIYCLLALPMLAGKIIGYLAIDFETKIVWFRVENSWWLPVATAMTCFILEYARPRRWLTRRSLLLLSIAPLLALALILTNDIHHLSIREYGFNGSVVPLYGPAGWAFVSYAFGLTIVNIIALVWLFARSPQHRWPAVMILTAQVIVRVLVVVDPLIQDSWFFFIPEFAFTVVACAIALFGFHIFDPIPLARQTAIEQLHAGVLALDPDGRIVSLNPAAEQMLSVPASRARGKPIKDLLPAYPERHLADSVETEIELGFREESSSQYYMLTISPLNDFRGLEVGRLLLLRNVTDQKKAQAQILEQQQVVSTLQERERLARELHDSLGQTLAATHLQASTARVLLAQGEAAKTDECLKQLADITIAAEADVREYLLGAKTVFSADRPFFESLRQYVTCFSQKYGMRVELTVPPRLEVQGLGQEIEVQLTRIIQEALSNVRKHARAQNVQVAFTVVDSRAQVAVTDDGQGFEPAAVTAQQVEGFGLQAMRERAETLGGSLEVLSQPGLGTKVIVHAPIEKDAETRR
jgi:signal transduction histidine kinase